MFLEHNAGFNNIETVQMSYKDRDLSHIASEITSGGKMECIASKKALHDTSPDDTPARGVNA
ncbi:hypothetical protein FNV34_00105 [Raoultella ornithinolytica]|nr:hypothetical protein FNV34_00105 [Raoultella ornithinolytica]